MFQTSKLEQSFSGRRSSNKVRFLFAGAILLVLLGIGGVRFFQSDSTKVQEELIEPSPVQEQKISKEPEYNMTNYTVEPGDTFEAVMRQFGVEPSDWIAVLEASGEIYDLNNLKDDHILRIALKDNPGLARLEYEYDDENILVVERSESGFSARNEPIEYNIEVEQVGGDITSSLFETASKLGIDDGVIMEITNILAWQVDFVSDVRAGDSFEVLYEKRFRNSEYADYGNILGVRFTNQGEDYWAVYFKDKEGTRGYYDLEGNSIKKVFLKSPLQYKYISSDYTSNRFHPVLKKYLPHEAIDYSAQAGTPIAAVGDGRVTYAGWKDGGDGIFVEIRHNETYTTRYSHMQKVADVVEVGAKVKQNDVIGYVGSTGFSTGSHLQYAMLENGEAVNPLEVDLPSGDPVNPDYMDEFKLKAEEVSSKLK